MNTVLTFLLFALYGCPETAVAASEASDLLAGNWQVDLRPSPDAEPYYQELAIKVSKSGRLSGRFYGSKFKKGLLNDAWPQLYFAFQTRDKNNTYFHSGYLDGDRLHGQTYCPERSFIAPWTATRSNEKIQK